MKKELGKWLMDIAKYVLTAVIVTSLVSDLSDTRWAIYALGILATFICLAGGLILVNDKKVESKKQ